MLTLALPALVLVAISILVPRLLERTVPESLPGLVALGAISGVALWFLSALGFALLYRVQGPEMVELLGARPLAGLVHFLTLGAKAALIWAPVLVLAVSTAPRRWREAVW